jgi:hypothetical protein
LFLLEISESCRAIHLPEEFVEVLPQCKFSSKR